MMLREIKDVSYLRLLWIISFEAITNQKFKGILKDFDLNKCSLEAILYSISVGVYLEEKNQAEIEECIKYNLFFVENSNDWQFGSNIILNNKTFRINAEVTLELYKAIEKSIILNFRHVVEEDISYELSYLNGILDNDNKIEYLNKKHLECWSNVKNPTEFLMYMGKSNHVIFKYWQDKIVYDFLWNLDLIKYYLSGSKNEDFKHKNSSFYNENYKDWVHYYRLKNIIELCVLKIDELQNEILKEDSEKPNLSILIFKDDGLKIFNFIILNYTDKKDKAFFSYLYYFLQAKKKINLYTKDNIIYREYVLNKFSYLKTFSRVISSNAENQYKKTDVEDNFNNILKSYSETN